MSTELLIACQAECTQHVAVKTTAATICWKDATRAEDAIDVLKCHVKIDQISRNGFWVGALHKLIKR